MTIMKFSELEQYQNFKLTCYDVEQHTKTSYNGAVFKGEKMNVHPDCEVIAMPILIREAKSYTRYFYPQTAHSDWAGKCKTHDIKRCQACSTKVFEAEEKATKLV